MSEKQDKPKLPHLKKPKKKGPNFWFQLVIVLAIFGLLIALSSGYDESQKEQEEKEITLSGLATEIGENNVESITVRGDMLEIVLLDGTEKETKKEREASLSETLVNYGVTTEQLADIDIEVKRESGFAYWFGIFAPFLVPLIILLLIIWFLSGQMKGAGMKAFSFGQSKARMVDPKDQKVSFKDVAGAKEAKEELLEVVDFLKNPKKFIDIGAKIPNGVLLMGAPGTGKTLLARAIAGEAKVPFFHLSGSEFVEMFVGVGASRVRDLFTMAKKASPAIIFIDEIDAVGRSRGVGIGGGNDEREQTLNQILVEMDGFEPNEKLIVIAATNRVDVLDPALLRPGRFDRRVTLDVPDRGDRKAILAIHARNKKMAEDVDLALVAERTPGFSGADLESLMNEAAILAARKNQKEITQNNILNSIDKVMIGPERKSHLHTEHERKVVAYHEAGHAVVSSATLNSDPVHKVSIIARGRAGGYTLKLPKEEKKLLTTEHYLGDIAMSMGGYAAEQLVFGDNTTGASNDIQVATDTARNMVTKWGMSPEIGPVALESPEGRVLYNYGPDNDTHSQKTQEVIDAEIKRILHEGREKAKEILGKHRDALDAVAEALLQHETLEQKEYFEIIKQYGIEPVEDK
jgi:cell division protease FtsH